MPKTRVKRVITQGRCLAIRKWLYLLNEYVSTETVKIPNILNIRNAFVCESKA